MKSLNSGKWFKNKGALDKLKTKMMKEHPGAFLPVKEQLKQLGKWDSIEESASRTHELELGEVRELLCRPWWTRVWIMQEAIVAKALILMCGDETADWARVEIRAEHAVWDVSDEGAFRASTERGCPTPGRTIPHNPRNSARSG